MGSICEKNIVLVMSMYLFTWMYSASSFCPVSSTRLDLAPSLSIAAEDFLRGGALWCFEAAEVASVPACQIEKKIRYNDGRI